MKIQLYTKIIGLLVLSLCIVSCEKNPADNITQWPINKDCNLHNEACVANMGDAEVSLKISPHPIPIARPLGIEVSTKNLAVQKIELDITGQSMYMGYNRVTLTSTSPTRYVGTSMLAFCTTQKMQWQVTLIVHQPDGTEIQIPYSLETINSH